MLNQREKLRSWQKLLLALAVGFQINGLAQGTVFTYQGRLNDNGVRANGTYDLTFTLYDSTNAPDSVVAGPITNASVVVSNGMFIAALDFGNVFDGNARYLEIAVRTNGGASFVPLTPRQPLTSVPYAIRSGSATNLAGPLSAANLALVTDLFAGTSNGLSSSFGTNLSLFTNIFAAQLTNGSAPLRNVINVKNPPYNAVGDGVHDDWVAIQAAITTACLSPKGPAVVYIPAGEYRITNTLALTVQTNVAIAPTGNTSISELFGDGGRRTVLRFTMTSANGLEFRVGQGDLRHLSNFSVHDLALMGPALTGNTNVNGSGYFFGYDANIPYGGDTTGWHDSIYNCLLMGWKQGLCITNTVFFTVRNCNFHSNVRHSVVLAHADTTLLENNNYGFPVVAQGDESAIYVATDVSGGAGQGVLSIGGECGDSVCFARVEPGGNFHQIGGNFERNKIMLTANGFTYTSFVGCHIMGSTNAPFVLTEGAAGGFSVSDCIIYDVSIIFDQRSSGPEYPIFHSQMTGKINGTFNGAPRNYPPVFFQTPRWSGAISLARAGALANATQLSFTNPSPAPFSSFDGIAVSNTTAQVWQPVPSGLGGNRYDIGSSYVQFTLMIQGGSGATNAAINLTANSVRTDPATGLVTDQSQTFPIPGISNGTAKSFTWSQRWVNDSLPHFVQLSIATTNQIYLIGLNGQTVDY